jgi:hypothetical protein
MGIGDIHELLVPSDGVIPKMVEAYGKNPTVIAKELREYDERLKEVSNLKEVLEGKKATPLVRGITYKFLLSKLYDSPEVLKVFMKEEVEEGENGAYEPVYRRIMPEALPVLEMIYLSLGNAIEDSADPEMAVQMLEEVMTESYGSVQDAIQASLAWFCRKGEIEPALAIAKEAGVSDMKKFKFELEKAESLFYIVPSQEKLGREVMKETILTKMSGMIMDRISYDG